ncbi:MAG: helix-turn-helix transcriptional regulator [Bacilli bacterium]|nr:helix-turn-helix transcriptional regulator [Bacilli bacterium]
MDIGTRIKKQRERQNISQEDLAYKVYVSRQTISSWETNKSYPDIKSLIILSNIFNVSLDDFIKGDIEEMRKKIDTEKIKEFNMLGYIYLIEMLLLIISAYPLFKFFDCVGVIIWIVFFIVTFYTATVIERFKKNNDIQTYKEILAFLDGTQLSYEESQQEIGKRMYQKIFYAVAAGMIGLIISLIVIYIIEKFLV